MFGRIGFSVFQPFLFYLSSINKKYSLDLVWSANYLTLKRKYTLMTTLRIDLTRNRTSGLHIRGGRSNHPDNTEKTKINQIEEALQSFFFFFEEGK